MTHAIREVTRETFEDEVLRSSVPVLIDFWGPRCGPCLALMPTVEGLASEGGDRLKVLKVEAPRNRRLCIELRVMSLPTFLVFVHGEEVRRITGDGISRGQLLEMAREYMQSAHSGA